MSLGSEDNRRLYDESRRRLNERSMAWGEHRRNVRWSEEEDEVILEEWVRGDPCTRDEMAISRQLGRTLFSCQARAETLRHELGISRPGSSRGQVALAERPVCDRCHMELPATNLCDTCD